MNRSIACPTRMRELMINKNNFSNKTITSISIAIILWASAFVGIRAGLVSYSPGPLALFRLLIASICMYFLYRRTHHGMKIPKKDAFLLIFVGAIGVGCYHYFLNLGEITIPSGTASFIISQSPLITLILAVIFLKEKFSINGLVGILVSILGVGLISFGESDGFQFDMGIFYVFISCVVGGLYSVMNKPFLGKYHAIDVTSYVIWGGTLSLIFYFPEMLREIPHATHLATFSVIYLGIFPAAVAYIAWSYALSQMPASKAVSFLYFMPIIATFLGWLFLNEIPAVSSLMGGLIALSGVWIANRR
jgi:drug/metabolite transporter (DMT)-like permease